MINTGAIHMKKISLVITLLSFLFAFTGVQANQFKWDSNRNNASVEIDVVDDSGRELYQYTANNRKNRNKRTYLEASKGKNYTLRLRNTSNERVGVVVAVDGRNILSGKKSHLRSNEKMYVLDPYETANYDGWRTSKNRVNRFYFTSAGNSYSNAWGDRSAMGVIAVAVFKEKHKQYGNRKYKRIAPSHRGYLSEDSAGTGFGDDSYSPTINVNFIAQNRADFKQFIKYEWRSNLCKRGVIDCNRYQDDRNNYYDGGDSYNRNHGNNRFWPREANNGFVPYPPSYKKTEWADQFTRSWDTEYKRGW
jgi:hypothetical protein